MTAYYLILYFFVYGFFGWCTEVGYAAVKEKQFVNRGFLNGPICPIYGVGVGVVVQFLSPYKSNLILLYISSVILVTLLEGVTGFALDKIFHNKWWDYSRQPLNIGGYVCLTFSLIWGAACVIIVDFIHPLIHTMLTYIPFAAGIILIVILGISMFADLYVTASGILKMNKRLEKMEKIALELHELSQQLGEDIYKGVIATLEKQEESRQKLETATSEWREKTAEVSEGAKSRIGELKGRYQELAGKGTHISKRLMKAFPKMESRKYKKQLEDLREWMQEKWEDK